MKRILLASAVVMTMAAPVSAQSQLPTGDQIVTLGVCASVLTATGAALGLTLAVPGAGPALAVLSLGCMIIRGGGD